MLFITYSLLVVYVLPIFLICLSAFTSNFFTLESNYVYIANAISGAYFTFFRDSFASIVIPLVTAYSIPQRDPEKGIPKATIGIFSVLLGMFVITTLLYALIKYREVYLAMYNEAPREGISSIDIPQVFINTMLSYAKEILAYIALLLGITLKK
jgi:hypothetical protein